MTWEIFLGITAIVSFVLSMVTVGSKLTSAITKLESSVINLEKSIARLDKTSDALEGKVENHEIRITRLEDHN